MNTIQSSPYSIKRIVEIILQLGALAFIYGWGLRIVGPFITTITWGAIIGITVYPIFVKLSIRLKHSPKIASAIVTMVLLSFILIPAALLTDSLVDGVRHFRTVIQEDRHIIPPPGPETANWPAFTKPLLDFWQRASDNLQSVALKYEAQVAAAAKLLFGLIAKTGIGILEFVLSIIIAGVLLVYADEGGGMVKKIFIRLAGSRGEGLANLCEVTIRNVVKGILGVAFIQAMMAGIGYAVAGVPAAGLWTVFSLIFAIIQVGVGPIMIPVIIYLFATSDTTTATLFLVWAILTMLSDNFLKPFLLGRGAPVPMLVVFLGAIGGFIARGFIGLFLGAVILSLGYELFLAWVSDKKEIADDAAVIPEV